MNVVIEHCYFHSGPAKLTRADDRNSPRALKLLSCFICGLFGTTSLFSGEQMASLYVDEAGFVTAVTEATNAAVAADFLLQEDADAIITWAPQQWRSQIEEP